MARKPFDAAALVDAVADAEGEDTSEVSVNVTVPLGPTDVVTEGGGVDVGSLIDVEVVDVPAEVDADDEVVAADADVEVEVWKVGGAAKWESELLEVSRGTALFHLRGCAE